MFELAVALVVVLMIAAVPRLRRAALSLLGLLAIIGVGTAVFAAVIWGLYESKPWLSLDDSAVVQEMSLPEDEEREAIETPQDDLTAALAAEDTQLLQDEQQHLEEEKLHVSIVAARARVILEDDRKLAAQATAFPLPAGVGEKLGDIMAIRIPAWRDRQLAAVQKESIRTWLQSLGLTLEETASIVTAKAWGSLYDLWVAETPGVAGPVLRVAEPDPAPTTAEFEPTAEEEPPPDPEQSSLTEAAQEPPPFVRQAPPPRARFRPVPRRIEAPRRSAPSRRYQPRREVGPFGY